MRRQCHLLVSMSKRAILLYFLLYMATFIFILPSILWMWPYSKFFALENNSPELVDIVNRNNQINLKYSSSVLSNINNNQFKSPVANVTDIAVGIITMRRTGLALQAGYLTQTVAYLLHQILKSQNMNRVVPFICNIDYEYFLHKEAMDMLPFMDVISQYQDVTSNREVYEKEKVDYSFCLMTGLKYKPKYVLLLEDDVLPLDNIFQVVDSKLLYINGKHAIDDWMYLKLYYPQKWQGFSQNIYHYLELIGIFIIGGMLGIGLFSCMSLLMCCRHKNLGNFYLIFILGGFYMMLLAICIGRPYMLLLRRGFPFAYSLVDAPGCCTQAVLYPNTMAERLSKHLATVTASSSNGVDLIIDKFATNNKLHGYLIEPSLVQHIGMVSSLRKKSKPAAEFV